MARASDESGFPRPIATVDAALFTLRGDVLSVALVRRDRGPHEGALALPGGYIHVEEDEDTSASARRVLREKAGIRAPHLEQLYTFSGRHRDPRGWSISVAYLAVVPDEVLRGSAAPSLEVVPADWVVPARGKPAVALPFDHAGIVRKGLERLRAKSAYSSLPAFLLPGTFTLSDLQRTYEKVFGTTLNKAAFRRKIEDQGLVEAVAGETRRDGPHRPAQLYRLADPKLTQTRRTLFEVA